LAFGLLIKSKAAEDVILTGNRSGKKLMDHRQALYAKRSTPSALR